MKTSFRAAIVVIVFLTTVASQLPAFAQGGLTPPGAPAPTMKSLDQVEPRTAITNAPFTITQSGSYYLTRSIEQTYPFYAISIGTNNVTLDLCGFTIRNTGTNNAVGVQITTSLNNYVKNVTVRNGIIYGFTNGSGVNALGARNCVFENLTVTECGNYGFLLQANGTAGALNNVIRDCRACDCDTGYEVTFGTGNLGNVIEHCEALNNTTVGFRLDNPGNLIVRCRAAGNAFNYSIGAGNRSGLWVVPSTNAATFNPPAAGPGSGTTDPFANLGY